VRSVTGAGRDFLDEEREGISGRTPLLGGQIGELDGDEISVLVGTAVFVDEGILDGRADASSLSGMSLFIPVDCRFNCLITRTIVLLVLIFVLGLLLKIAFVVWRRFSLAADLVLPSAYFLPDPESLRLRT
jgi:hypothetical protein